MLRGACLLIGIVPEVVRPRSHLSNDRSCSLQHDQGYRCTEPYPTYLRFSDSWVIFIRPHSLPLRDLSPRGVLLLVPSPLLLAHAKLLFLLNLLLIESRVESVCIRRVADANRTALGLVNWHLTARVDIENVYPSRLGLRSERLVGVDLLCGLQPRHLLITWDLEHLLDYEFLLLHLTPCRLS